MRIPIPTAFLVLRPPIVPIYRLYYRYEQKPSNFNNENNQRTSLYKGGYPERLFPREPQRDPYYDVGDRRRVPQYITGEPLRPHKPIVQLSRAVPDPMPSVARQSRVMKPALA